MLFLYIRMHVSTVRAKKLAKVLLFFHIRKYFYKKMQFFRDFLDFVQLTWQKHARMGLQS